MAKKVSEYKKDITKALKDTGKYSRSLEPQIDSLAGALRALGLANDDIDELETTTISTVSRYGNKTMAPHPVFKIQKDAQDSVTRQMKALGLTTADLEGATDDDPLADLTNKLIKTTRKSAKIIRPDA